MASLTLLDSDVLIDVLRKDALAEALLTTVGGAGPMGISVVSRMETIRGCRNREVQQRAEKLLRRFQELSLLGKNQKDFRFSAKDGLNLLPYPTA